MSNVIDQKVVEMQFDNKNFESNAKQSISTLGALKTAISYLQNPVDTVRKSFEKLKEIDLEPLTVAIDNATISFGNFTKTVVDVYAIGTAVRALQTLESQVISLTKSMSVDQISSGWSKYAEKTVAVQTIMAATGKSVDEVNEALDRLAWFSDETSYSFTDMTSNLGKFTSAGVDLESGIKAMMGISTAAALSGQGISEASRAMYNFAQALATGSVKLIDWKSIENANMATVEFKQAIMDAAVETGDLVKVQDKYYTKTKRSAVTTENFSTTLNEGWFSAKTLLKSLEAYGGYADKLYEYMNNLDDPTLTASEAIEQMGYSVDDLGYKSFKAAQEALTFRHAIDSVKDAASSGWSTTFENIFGNYDEARKLWTTVANELYDIFITDINGTNDLLSEALGLNHREKLIAHIESVGGTEEEFYEKVAEALKRQGVNLRGLMGDYKTFEEYLKNSDAWATPEIVSEAIGDMAKAFTVAGNTPKQAEESWENLQNRIEAAGGSFDVFKKKAAELTGLSLSGYDLSDATIDNYLQKKLTSSLISETFAELAKEGEHSNKVIQKNSVSLQTMNKLIDDILAGKLGVGQERIDALTKKGMDAAKVQELVNKRVRTGSIELSDLNGTLLGVESASAELIQSYKDLSALYETTGEDLKKLSEESKTAGTEMYRLSKYFSTESGREFIAASIIEMLQQLKAAMDVVKEAWNDVFPPITALRLTEIIQGIKNFIFSLRLSDEASENLKNTFKGLFSILRLGKQIIQSVLHLFSPILKNIVGIRDGILGITGAFGKGLDNVTKTLGSIFDAFRNNTTLQTVSDFFERIGLKIIETAKNFSSLFTYTDLGNIRIFEIIEDTLDKVWHKILDLREAFLLVWNGNPLQDPENEFARFSGIIQGVKHVLEDLSSYARIAIAWLAKQISSLTNYTKMLFSNLNLTITTFFTQLKNLISMVLKTISNPFWIVKFNMLLKRLQKFFNGFNTGEFLISVKRALKDFGEFFRDAGYTINRTIEEIGYTIKEKGRMFQAQAVTQMAFGISIIAGACFLLAQVPADKLIPAAAAIAGMTTILTKALKELSKPIVTETKGSIFDIFKRKITKVNPKQLIPLAAAVAILAKAAKDLGSLEVGAMIKGVTGVGIMLKMLTQVMKTLQNEKKTFVKGGTTAILMAVAVRLLVGAVKPLGEMRFTDMLQGVTGVGLILTELAFAYELLSRNKSKFQTGGIVLMMMSGSVRIMQSVFQTFADMDWGGVGRAAAGIGAVLIELSAAYVFLSKNGSIFQTGGVTLVLMAASVKILSNVLKELGEMSDDNLLKGWGGVTALLAELVIAYRLLSWNKSKFQTGGLVMVMMAGSVKILGSTIKMLSSLQIANMWISIGALTFLFAELIALFEVLARMKEKVAQAMIGIAAIFAVNLAMKPLLNSLVDLSRMKPERLVMAIGAVSFALIATAGSLALLQFLPGILGPVMIGIAALGAIVVEIGLLIAAMGGLYQIPGAQWIIGEGKKFLHDIGDAIGSFFGGMIQGTMGAESVDLGKIADKLTKFMLRMQPFFILIGSIDENVLGNLKALNQIMGEVVQLAMADWVFKLGNNGKSSFEQIGEQMQKFGSAIHSFVSGVLGVNTSAGKAEELNADNLKLIKDSLDTVHEFLGWQLEIPRKEFAAFTENLRKFSGSLKSLGPAVAAFFAGILMLNANGEPAVNNEQLTLIKEAVPIVTDLANTEFKATSDEFGEFGSKMQAFADKLPGLGTALNQFIKETAGLIEEDPSTIKITQGDVDHVKAAVPIVTDLAAIDFSTSQETPLFGAKTNFELFGEQLPDFGTALNKFITGVLKIEVDTTGVSSAITENDVSTVSSAVGIVSQLAGISFTGDASGVETLGGQMEDFGNGLEALGPSLGIFINGLAVSGFTVDGEQKIPPVSEYKIGLVSKAVNAVAPLAELDIKANVDGFGNLKSNLSTFGNDLNEFGPILTQFISGLTAGGFTTDGNPENKIPPIDYNQIALAEAAIKAMVPLCEVKLPHTRGLLDFLKGGEGTLSTLASGLADLAEPLHDFVVEFGKYAKSEDMEMGWYSSIENAKHAVSIIAALSEIKIPESSGFFQWLEGGSTLDMLVKGNTLAKVGGQLSSFVRAFIGNDFNVPITNDDAVHGPIAVAKEAVSIIDALAQIKLPDKTLGQNLLGNNLENFASTLGAIGEGLRSLIVNLTNLQIDETTGLPKIDLRNDFITLAVIPAIDILEQLSSIIPAVDTAYVSTGDFFESKLTLFAASLPAIGEYLRGFIDGVAGITENAPEGDLKFDVVKNVEQAANVIVALSEAAKNIVVGKAADFKKFGEKLEGFVPYVGTFLHGINDLFNDKEDPLDMKRVESVLSVIPLLSALLDKDLPSVDEVDENTKSYIRLLADDLKYFISTLNGETFRNANLTEILNFIDSAQNADAGNFDTFISEIIADIQEINNVFSEEEDGVSLESIGRNVIQGLINGLNDLDLRTQLAQTAGSLATLTKQEIANALGIASPSKETFKIGQYVDEGFIKGLESGQNSLQNVASKISGTVLDALKIDYNSLEISGLDDTVDQISDAFESVSDAIDPEELKDIETPAKTAIDAVFGVADSAEEAENSLKKVDISKQYEKLGEKVGADDLYDIVYDSVDKSNLGHAVEEAIEDTNVDDVAGFADQVINTFDSRGEHMREIADGLIATILADYKAMSGQFQEVGADFGNRLAEGLKSTSGTVVGAAQDLRTNLIDEFIRELNKIDLIDENGDNLLQPVTDFINALEELYGEDHHDFAFDDILTSLQEAINAFAPDVSKIDLLKSFAEAMKDLLSGNYGGDESGVVNFLNTLGDSIKMNKALLDPAAVEVVELILSVFERYYSRFVTIGINFITNLAEGMETAIPIAKSAANAVAAEIVGSFESTITNDASRLGQSFTQGIADGIDQSKDKVESALKNIFGVSEESTEQEGLNLGQEDNGSTDQLSGSSDPESYGQQYGQQFANGVIGAIENSGIQETIDTIEASFEGLQNSISTLGTNVDYTSLGEIGSQLEDAWANDMQPIVEEITGAMNAIFPDGYGMVTQMMQGMIDAFNNEGLVAEVVAAAAEFAGKVTAALKINWQINSPSKVTYRLAAGLIEGVELGIEENGDTAVDAMRDFGGDVTDAGEKVFSSFNTDNFQKQMSRLAAYFDQLDEEFDYEPTITPVLDLSQISSGASRIDSMLSREKAYMINSQFGNEGNEYGAFGRAPVYQFTQNNYSPKALSRYEIYRQTKNQFAMLKGMTS